MDRDLDDLIEQAIVDAYGDDEQRVGFLTMLDEHLGLPFESAVLGSPVTVTKVDVRTSGGIVARCSRDGAQQWISLLDLPLPSPPPAGAEWIAAYRRWAKGVGDV